jgi:hypothetical protein
LLAITIYHLPICRLICFITLVRLSFPYWCSTGNPVYLISTIGSRRVWPVSRCLSIHPSCMASDPAFVGVRVALIEFYLLSGLWLRLTHLYIFKTEDWSQYIPPKNTLKILSIYYPYLELKVNHWVQHIQDSEVINMIDLSFTVIL